ncbi:MAG: hypothetical protein CMK59_04165 [Proteobacteria bacterium]|nr:hypothetical protein [Pseudomonadota bacterium]
MNPQLTQLLSEYAEDHTHPTNRSFHKVGVPLVLFHILAMLDWVHIYPSVDIVTEATGAYTLSLGHIFAVLVAIWYIRLSLKLAAVVGVAALLCFAISPHVGFMGVISVTILAWVFQLIGHGVYEKRTPAFLRNLLQLLVGPLFMAALLLGEWPIKDNGLSKEQSAK